MSNIIETIRAEILRYRNKSAEELGVGFLESDKAKTFTNGGVAWVCEHLLSVLDTLEVEEKSSEKEVFHRLLDRYFNESDDVKKGGTRLMQYSKMEVVSFKTIRRTDYRLYVKTEVNDVEYQ